MVKRSFPRLVIVACLLAVGYVIDLWLRLSIGAAVLFAGGILAASCTGNRRLVVGTASASTLAVLTAYLLSLTLYTSGASGWEALIDRAVEVAALWLTAAFGLRGPSYIVSSEERLRRVVEHMPVMMEAFDEQGRVAAWNRECERVTGYSAAEIVGNPRALEILYPSETYRKRMLREWLQRGNEYRDWEWQLTCKDGTVRTISWSNLSADFPVRGWANWGTGVDVTERNQARDALQRSELRFRAIVEESPYHMQIYSPDGRLQLSNPACPEGWGMDQELRRSLWKRYNILEDPHLQDLGISELVQRAFGGEVVRTPEVIYDPAQNPLTAHLGLPARTIRGVIYPIRNPEGDVQGVVAAWEDLTERVLAESRAQESEKTARALLDSIPDAVLLLNREGEILEMNEAAGDRLGIPPLEALGRPVLELLPHDAAQSGKDQLEKAVRTKQPVRIEVALRDRVLSNILCPIVDSAGQVVRLAEVSRDITQERKTVERLREREQCLAEAQRIAHLGNWSWDVNDKRADWSDETYRIFGLNPRRFKPSSEAFLERVHPDDRNLVRRSVDMALAGRQPYDFLHRIIHPDGTIRTVRERAEVQSRNGRPIRLIGTVQDVTRQCLAEQALKTRADQQASVAALGQSALSGIGYDELVEQAMRAVQESLGLDLCSMLDYRPSDDSFLLRWGRGWRKDQLGRVVAPAGSASPARMNLESRAPVIIEDLESDRRFADSLTLRNHGIRSGVSVPVLGAGYPHGSLAAFSRQQRSFTDDDCHFMQAVANILAAARQRHLNEEKIRASLTEKEVLLKELHHRVKNNLQIIQSLLSLQARRSGDPRAVRILRDSQGRVRSMSLIHEKLYNSKNLSRIHFGDYLRDLVLGLARSLSLDGCRVEARIEADDLYLDIETALPCGLLVNELVTNSLSHAFAGRTRGRIGVFLKRQGDALRLTVTDDGQGFIFPTRPQEGGTLGLQLIHALAEQLDASIDVETEQGTRISLLFPKRCNTACPGRETGWRPANGSEPTHFGEKN